MFSSIRTRLTAVFLAFQAMLLLFSNTALIYYTQQRSDERAHRLLQAAVHKVQPELRLHPAHLSFLLEDERTITKEYLVVMIVDPHAHILQKSGQFVPPWPHTTPDHWRIATIPFGANTAVIGLYWKRTDDNVMSQAGTLAILSLLILIFAGFGSWLLVERTLSPIHRLSQQARVASSENLTLQLSAPSDDAEVVELVSTLNDFLSRLAHTTAARGRFYAAASHELRTPLQTLAGNLELALRRERTAQEYRIAIEKAYPQARRLVSLVRDLLLLNQLEATPLPATERIDLTELCLEIMDNLRPLAEAQQLRVGTELLPGIRLEAPPTHMEMLLRNVIENALKYATPGGKVVIEMSAAPIHLSVFNAFPYQEEWQGDNLFEPFFRPDPARRTHSGGNGLGLALCKAIADANGWHITLQQVENGILCTLRFS